MYVERQVLTGFFLAITSFSAMSQSEAIVIFRRSAPEVMTDRATVYLSVGDSAVVEVWAKSQANHTKIAVKQGSKYRFVVPSGQVWTDWFIRSDANGYPHGPLPFLQEAFQATKPLPDKNWFLLVGAIDRPENATFAIGGKPIEVLMNSSGGLILFANDSKWFYWNNFGRIQVIVTRVL
jgi:hypothetical protein